MITAAAADAENSCASITMNSFFCRTQVSRQERPTGERLIKQNRCGITVNDVLPASFPIASAGQWRQWMKSGPFRVLDNPRSTLHGFWCSAIS
jgi:hypothetical protein